MAAGAVSRMLLPRRGLYSLGLKRLVGPGASFQVREQSSSARDSSPANGSQGKGSFVTVCEHEKAIAELTSKHDKAVMDLGNRIDKAMAEQKHCFDLAIVALRYDMKKDADEKSIKHYIDQMNSKNEVKALDDKFEAKFREQELKLELHISKGETRRLKGFGWFLGASTAFISRFSNLPDIIFKGPKGSP
ncbi:unnamed protein product [Urochloa decumbens]|uniref:Uncharacterized protein n=1 Tax=Urochloa decumbens TaxID=240449 RepID=A0ABC9ECG0_9POAL